MIAQNERPDFYERQYLGSADLDALLNYGRVQRARHWLGSHTWGIAAGLELVVESSPAGGGAVDVFVLPGYAWDGFGRAIVVLGRQQIQPGDVQTAIRYSDTAGHAEVWICYREEGSLPPPRGYEHCSGNGDHSRVRETFELVFRDRGGEFAPERLPNEHDSLSIDGTLVDAEAVLATVDPTRQGARLWDESVAFQELPDPDEEPDANWCVFLGYVQWKNDGAGFRLAAAEDSYKCLTRIYRRYIGVVAETVLPAGEAVHIRSRTKNPFYLDAQLSTLRPWSDEILQVEGDVRLDEDLRLYGGLIELRSDGTRDKKNAVPPRCTLDPDAPAWIRRTVQTSTAAVDLQLLIPPPEKGTSRLIVATASPPSDRPTFLRYLAAFQSDGKVGLGTVDPMTEPAPSQALTVAGIGNVFVNVLNQAGRDLHLGVATDGGHLLMDSPHNLHIGGTQKKPILDVASGGNTGLGAAQDNAHLAITSTNPVQGTIEFFTGDADIEYSGGTGKRFVIKNSGDTTQFLGGKRVVFLGTNIGIDDPTPSARLSILLAAGGKDRLDVFDGQNDIAYHGGADGKFVIRNLTARTELAGGKVLFIESSDVGIGIDPTERLTVEGKIKFGPQARLHVVGAGEPLRLVRYSVPSDGIVPNGAPIAVNHVVGTGRYTVTFDAFDDVPFASVTQLYPEAIAQGAVPNNVRHRVLIASIAPGSMEVVTIDSAGQLADREFMLLVVGTKS